jgi:hypothetical protein
MLPPAELADVSEVAAMVMPEIPVPAVSVRFPATMSAPLSPARQFADGATSGDRDGLCRGESRIGSQSASSSNGCCFRLGGCVVSCFKVTDGDISAGSECHAV